jgi:hypothetical protein
VGSKIRRGLQDARILLHQGTLPTIFEIDTVRVEIAFGRDNHDLGHRPNDRDTMLSGTARKNTDRSSDAPTESNNTSCATCWQLEKREIPRRFPHLRERVRKVPTDRRRDVLREMQRPPTQA